MARLKVAKIELNDHQRNRFLSCCPPGQPADRCWDWPKYFNEHGYGIFHIVGTRRALAHRVSWTVFHGAVPDELFVLHKCDRPICFAPHHLFLGDQSDNIADKLRKGRQPRGAEHHAHLHPEKMRRGSTHGQAKLTEADVTEMRRRYVNGETVASISKDYPVWYMQVKNAVKRITWRHVP